MLVIGNGESRKNINLDAIHDTKIGCNAILRDFDVDHLVCVDRKMVQEAIAQKYNDKSIIYTRSDWIAHFSEAPNVTTLPNLPYHGDMRWDQPIHWGSGPYAVLLGCMLAKDFEVKLLGFDLYSIDQKINNIYKGTTNYNDSGSKGVDPRYWIKQIETLIGHFPKTRFKIYAQDGWKLPENWLRANVVVDDINKLL